MDKGIAQKNEIKLIGITIRTNNTNEGAPETSKIGKLVDRYKSEKLSKKIPNRVKPDVTYAVYTNYESDERGDYTYFLGEEVSSFENMPDDFETLIIPPSRYQTFTTEPGPMPLVVINAWQEIWNMSAEALGGERKYIADFEIYDQRAANPNTTVIDIFIGIK